MTSLASGSERAIRLETQDIRMRLRSQRAILIGQKEMSGCLRRLEGYCKTVSMRKIM
jgi:hypothetical protein